MAIELKPIASSFEFEFGDESGYRFKITATLDNEWGWGANVYVQTYGLANQENSVKALIPGVENLLRMLKEKFGEEQGDKKNV